MKEIQVTIKGTSPLLMHRFPMAGADEPSKKRTGSPDWRAEAEKALYKDEKGVIYQPSSHLEGSLKNAAKSFKISGKRGATYSKLLGATVEVLPHAIPHKITKYEIDAQPVVVQRARIIRYRPRFDEWELDFTLTLSDDQLPIEVMKMILDYAGAYVGIGDFRPQRGGKFGKFMVTKFEEIAS
jgi:hypothetical protein